MELEHELDIGGENAIAIEHDVKGKNIILILMANFVIMTSIR